jgi:hypothetical protein
MTHVFLISMGNHFFKFLSSWCFLKHLSAKMQAWWKKKGEGSPSKTLLSSHQRISANTHTNAYVYIYMCTFTCVCIHTYIYIHTLHHIALHCITLQFITLHCTTLHYITLHYTISHHITHHIASHYTALHHVTCITCKCDIYIYIFMHI